MIPYRTKPRWTKAQIDYLKNNYATMKDEHIALHLGKSVKSVRRQRENLNLTKINGRGLVGPADGSSPVIDFNKQKTDINEVIRKRKELYANGLEPLDNPFEENPHNEQSENQ